MAELLPDPWNAAGGPAPAWWSLLPGDMQEDMRAAAVAQIAQGFFMHEDEIGCARVAALVAGGPAARDAASCDCCACDMQARERRQIAAPRKGAAVA